MALDIVVGSRWRSVVCDTQIIVVKGAGWLDLHCGGHPFVSVSDADVARARIDPELTGGTLLGKRYADSGNTIEVLCTKAGDGTITLHGEPLLLVGARALPSSD
jgi:hypothetical protein